MKEFKIAEFMTASIVKVANTYNLIVGALITVLTAVFGIYWYIFLGYFVANVLDWLTGWAKARKNKTESSAVGLHGIVKKTGYWVIIAVSFMVPNLLIPIGKDMLGLELSFLFAIGWYTLCTLFINELRSILENLVEMNYYVPEFLIKGLRIAQDTVNNVIPIGKDEDKEE